MFIDDTFFTNADQCAERDERVREVLSFLDGEGIPGIIKEKSFSAGMLRITVEAENGEELVASRHGIDYALSPGEKVQICFKREQAVAVEENDAT